MQVPIDIAFKRIERERKLVWYDFNTLTRHERATAGINDFKKKFFISFLFEISQPAKYSALLKVTLILGHGEYP